MSKKKNEVLSLSERERNYRVAFASDAGQRVIQDLKKLLRYGENLYFKGQSTEDLHYHMGRLSVLHDILFILDKEGK